MTTLNANQKEFAMALYDATLTGKPLEEKDWKSVVEDDETAYAVQDEVMRLKGVPVGGYKVSLTSKQTQDMFDADSPLYGQQVNRRFLPAPANVSLNDLMEPLVEVELAFRATTDLTSNDSLEDLLNKTTVAGALEVPDSRFKDWFPSLGKYNVMSDCTVGGLVVYGKEVPSTKVFKDVADVATVHAELFLDDQKLDVIQKRFLVIRLNPFNGLSKSLKNKVSNLRKVNWFLPERSFYHPISRKDIGLSILITNLVMLI